MSNAKNYAVFFDFDNTITAYDVLDDMLARFSKDDKWMVLEEQWKKGKIGSLECLEGQLKSIRIDKKSLDKYLGTIELDPYFKKLLQFFYSKKIKVIILSDNFDYILHRILKINNVSQDVSDIYSNALKIQKSRLLPRFPFTDPECGDCAHCKKTSLLNNVKADETSVYIGDGQSDICASKSADIVFAKGHLRKHYRDEKLPCVPFKKLKDVYECFKKEEFLRDIP